MCPFAAEIEKLPIRESASKYLYFMYYVRSSSPETLRSYESDLRQAFNLGEKILPSLDDPDSDDTSLKRVSKPPKMNEKALLTACREAQTGWVKLAPASRNRKAACLKSFLNWLYDEGAITRDLSAQIHAPSAPQRLPHHLSVDEVLALIQCLRKARDTASTELARTIMSRNLTLILLLYGGGLRVSEACQLKWVSVDLHGRLLRIMGKGGHERIVALPPMTTQALSELKNAGGESRYVFGDEGLPTRKAYEIVRASGVQAGLLKPLHPHALRHSFATHLLSSGANLRTLQELLGHRTLQATQRYTHLGIDQLANTLEKFHPTSHANLDNGVGGKKVKR